MRKLLLTTALVLCCVWANAQTSMIVNRPIIRGIGDNGTVPIEQKSVTSTKNSTSELLGVNETYYGEAEDISDYSFIAVNVGADVAGTLFSQVSTTGTSNWRDGESYLIRAGTTSKDFTPPAFHNYFRIGYTNDGTAQSEFHIDTTLHKKIIKASSHNVNYSLNDEDDAELVVAVPKLRTAQNDYVSMASTSSGNAKISLEELESGISSNNNSQLNITQFDSSGNEIESQQVASSTDSIDDKYGLVTASGLYGRIDDSTVRPLRANPSTHTLITIDYQHHELHNGSHYFFSENITLGNGASQDYLITTPDTTTWGHFLYKITGAVGVTVGLYEGADRTGTTLQTIYNNNRNSGNTATITVHKGQSGGTTDGTQIVSNGFGSGTVGGSGGNVSREDEIILLQNTKYIFRVTNRATVNNIVGVHFTWYEHADRD